jgi:hypothetical protein
VYTVYTVRVRPNTVYTMRVGTYIHLTCIYTHESTVDTIKNSLYSKRDAMSIDLFGFERKVWNSVAEYMQSVVYCRLIVENIAYNMAPLLACVAGCAYMCVQCWGW